jgi:hypothetical protein
MRANPDPDPTIKPGEGLTTSSPQDIRSIRRLVNILGITDNAKGYERVLCLRWPNLYVGCLSRKKRRRRGSLSPQRADGLGAIRILYQTSSVESRPWRRIGVIGSGM